MQVKTELEDISFMYLHTDEYQEIARRVAQKKVERQAYIDELIEIVKRPCARASAGRTQRDDNRSVE